MHKSIDLFFPVAYNFGKKYKEMGRINMRTPGMLRKMDDLGRIVIPSELRQALELEKGDQVELYLEEERLVLKKFMPACIFCGSTEGIMQYMQKNICTSCIDTIKRA